VTSGPGVTAQDNSKPRHVYELRFEEDTGLLMRRGTVTGAQFMSTATIAAHKSCHVLRARVKAHREMLGTLHHLEPAFSPGCWKEAKAFVLVLIETAGAYGCGHVVKVHIENYFHSRRWDTLYSCAVGSVEMLAIAVSIKSDWVFKEAATYLIGGEEEEYEAAKPKLEELGVRTLFERKRAEFIQRLQKCELEMFAHTVTEPDGNQLAIHVFREWLSHRLKSGQGSSLRCHYEFVYRDLHEGEHYDLTKDWEIQNLLKSLSNTVKSERLMVDVELGVKATFAWARCVIVPIMLNLTLAEGMFDTWLPLTFMGVDDDELPWVKAKKGWSSRG